MCDLLIYGMHVHGVCRECCECLFCFKHVDVLYLGLSFIMLYRIIEFNHVSLFDDSELLQIFMIFGGILSWTGHCLCSGSNFSLSLSLYVNSNGHPCN